MVDARLVAAGEVVERVDAPDTGRGVVEPDVQALRRMRQVEVEQMAVALDENSLGVGHGDVVAGVVPEQRLGSAGRRLGGLAPAPGFWFGRSGQGLVIGGDDISWDTTTFCEVIAVLTCPLSDGLGSLVIGRWTG